MNYVPADLKVVGTRPVRPDGPPRLSPPARTFRQDRYRPRVNPDTDRVNPDTDRRRARQPSVRARRVAWTSGKARQAAIARRGRHAPST